MAEAGQLPSLIPIAASKKMSASAKPEIIMTGLPKNSEAIALITPMITHIQKPCRSM